MPGLFEDREVLDISQRERERDLKTAVRTSVKHVSLVNQEVIISPY